LAAILRPSPALRVLGVVTVGCSIAALALLAAMIGPLLRRLQPPAAVHPSTGA
jgi:hypothetical protein